MTMKRTIARNVLWSWAGTLTDMAVGFILARYLLKHLGDTRYGLWLIIASLTSYFSYFDLGVRSSVGRYIAYYRARGDQERVNAIVSTAFFFLSAVALLVFACTLALPLLFFDWYDVAADQQSGVQTALFLVGVNLALTFPLSIFDATLWGLQRFDIQNIIEIPASLLRGGLTLGLVASGGGLVAIAWVVVLVTLATAACKVVFTFRSDPTLRMNPRRMSRDAALDLFSFGLWQFVLSIGRRIPGQLAAPVIGAKLMPDLVPPQSVAARLPAYAESLTFSGTGVLTPVATGLHATENHDQQRVLFLEGGKFCTALALFFVILFVCIGESLVTLWMDRELQSVGLLLTILALGELLPLSQWMSYSVVLGMGRHRTLALFSVLENVLVFTLMFILVQTHGVVGVCLALAIPGMFCRGMLQLLYSCHVMQVPLRLYAVRTLLPAVLTAAGPAVLLAVLTSWHRPAAWL